MPGLQFQDLPAAETQKIRDALHAQWQIEDRALGAKPFKSQQQADAESAKLDAKYQQMELKALMQLQQQQQERKRVQSLIQQPQERTRAEEAQLRMELEPEAERLVFPAEPQPFSISQITSPRLIENIRAYAEGAPDTPGIEWGPPKKTKEGIINQYKRWQESIQYDALAPIRQRQLDIQWDEAMAEDPRYDKWWSNREKRQPIVEVKALRTPGDIGKIMRGRVVGATPIGTSIKKDKPRSAISRMALPYSGEEMRRLYGGKSAPAAASQQQYPRPQTQADYNRIPSGTRYVGSDGQLRIKR